MEKKAPLSRWWSTLVVGAAGLIAGGVLAGTLSASADESGSSSNGSGTSSGTGSPGAPYGPGMPGGGPGMHGGGPGDHGDPSQPQRADESLLNGSTASRVKAAALNRYPGATVVRLETDSDGVYEAHMTKADGTPVTVEVDKTFAVTGEEEHGPGA